MPLFKGELFTPISAHLSRHREPPELFECAPPHEVGDVGVVEPGAAVAGQDKRAELGKLQGEYLLKIINNYR